MHLATMDLKIFMLLKCLKVYEMLDLNGLFYVL